MTKKAQIDKFREKARELEADPDERAFDDALRKVAHGGPKGRGEADLSERQSDRKPKTKR